MTDTSTKDSAPAFATFADGDAPLFALEDTDGPTNGFVGAPAQQQQHQYLSHNSGSVGGAATGSPMPLPSPTASGPHVGQQHLAASGSLPQGFPAPAAGSPPTLSRGGMGSGSNSHSAAMAGAAAAGAGSADAQHRNVYVASLPASFTDDNLRDLFTPFGTIVSCKMFNNDSKPGSQGRAYGFVMFGDESSVPRAIDALVGAVVGGQRIQVRRAKQTSRAPSQAASANPTPSNSSSQAMLMAGASGGGGGRSGGGGTAGLLPAGALSAGGASSPPQQAPPAGYVMVPAGGIPQQPQPQQQSSSLTLQSIGTNQYGQAIFLTPTGQQVVLAMPTAPLQTQQVQPVQQQQQPVQVQQQPVQAQQSYVMVPQQQQQQQGQQQQAQPQQHPTHTQLPPQQPAFFFR